MKRSCLSFGLALLACCSFGCGPPRGGPGHGRFDLRASEALETEWFSKCRAFDSVVARYEKIGVAGNADPAILARLLAQSEALYQAMDILARRHERVPWSDIAHRTRRELERERALLSRQGQQLQQRSAKVLKVHWATGLAMRTAAERREARVAAINRLLRERAATR